MSGALLEAFRKPEPLLIHPGEEYASIVSLWQKHDFTSQGMDRVLGMKQSALESLFDIHRTLRKLDRQTPFAVLFELFRLNVPVKLERAQKHLGQPAIDHWKKLGLLVQDGDELQSPFNVKIYEGLYCLGDASLSNMSDENLVLGINPTATITASIMIREPVATALDLCTGNGFLALLAARFAKRVIGTDINPRCLNLARFNARLNGIQNVEWRMGSWLEPVDGERFDLISCNPPFVLSPETQFVFRDANVGGEGITAQLAQAFPDYLNPNGHAVVIGNWSTQPKGDWAEPPRRWLSKKGVDVVVFRGGQETGEEYAYHWLGPHYVGKTTELEAAVDRWTEHFRQHGIQEITFGAIIERKRESASQHGFVTFEVSREEARHMPCGEQLQHIFRSFDLLSRHQQPNQLLELRLAPREDVVVEQRMAFKEGTFQFRDAALFTTKGIRFTDKLDNNELVYYGLFNGQRTLREVIQEMAMAMEMPFDQILGPGLELAQRWLFRTYLQPV